jgi:hypothetical protein
METKITKKKTSAKAEEAGTEKKTKAEAGATSPSPAERKPAGKKTGSKPKAAAKAKPIDPFAEIAGEEKQIKPKKKVRVAASTVKRPAAKPFDSDVPAKAEVVQDVPKAETLKTEVERSPAFKKLAEPKLPELKRDNRARLQMQTPTRLYFYWSVKENPWALLKRAFGEETGSYTLVLKLNDLRRGTEEIHPADASGNWWFNVDPDGEYRSEIGFYAPNRPYFRIIYSNTVETPRRSPSPRPASEARWTVSASKFAEVLDAAGFSHDAFDVAVAGDDKDVSRMATESAFHQFTGKDVELDGFSEEDIRKAMLHFAAGGVLEELRWQIGPSLFAALQANAGRLVSRNAIDALTDHFDVSEDDLVEEQLGPQVFGASMVHFPKTLKTRTVSSKRPRAYGPVSSHERPRK